MAYSWSVGIMGQGIRYFVFEKGFNAKHVNLKETVWLDFLPIVDVKILGMERWLPVLYIGCTLVIIWIHLSALFWLHRLSPYK